LFAILIEQDTLYGLLNVDSLLQVIQEPVAIIDLSQSSGLEEEKADSQMMVSMKTVC